MTIDTTIVILSPAFVPQTGDLHIQNPRPPEGALCIDPQHGGHRPGQGWPVVEPGDAACSYALRLRRAIVLHCRAEPIVRLVLPPNASLDSWVAAAALSLETLPADVADLRQRVTDLAVADGAQMVAAAADWYPGQDLRNVSEDRRFAGLCRLVACAALPPERRLALVQRWLVVGVVDGLLLHEEQALGIWSEDWPVVGGADKLPELTLVALDEIASAIGGAKVQVFLLWITRSMGTARLDAAVALVTSSMSGLSGGRGALSKGYQVAPVVVAVSPTGDPRVPEPQRGPLCTIARAANARSVPFPFAAIVAALNTAEAEARGVKLDETTGRWGGNPQAGIIGSPKPAGHWQGTRLRPERIAEIVLLTQPPAQR